MRWWPRSIRWQMLLGLVLLEALSIVLFVAVLVRLQNDNVRNRVHHRLIHEATSLALEAEEAFEQNRPDWADVSVRVAGGAPGTLRAKITDAFGKVLFISAGNPDNAHLSPEERNQIRPDPYEAHVFATSGDRWEAVKPIFVGYDLRGYAWVMSDPLYDDVGGSDTVRAGLIFGCIWILASFLLVGLVSQLIAKPLETLHSGTRALAAQPNSTGIFPLPVTVHNEFGDLIRAFNSMVASIEEQRAGLSDTLSLLDSMLANAPVGLAFFDRHLHFVRVNQNFAELLGMPVSRILGKTLAELMPDGSAQHVLEALSHAFASGEETRDMELRGGDANPARGWTWLVSAYPIRTTPEQVRWAGIIVRDVSERVRAEEALRKTEKLAATGRLAASIAHEINNPLEALTNLLFLLRNFSDLTPAALRYLEMAEHETRRISEIAQQTLRFYRQSTLPQRATLAELIDSVLDLYRSRLNTLEIDVKRDYDPAETLFCFSGEIRQVVANFVGNATDAMSAGGRLRIRARRSRDWHNLRRNGLRITFADSGAGMEPDTLSRIFEAFFTTKEDTGTGLGLWVSQEIIAKHGGSVRVRSRIAATGRPSGTVFQIFLPDDETLGTGATAATAAGSSLVGLSTISRN
ncbi:MAG: sensor histidine kinase [Acidobacteriota bacterium]